MKALATGGPGRTLARRFVAGETLDDALDVARQLQGTGARVSLDYLGEAIARFDQALEAARAYQETIDRVGELASPVSLAIKPSQFGIDLSPGRCLDVVAGVVDYAGHRGVGVRFDMEDARHTDATLWLWDELRKRGLAAGVVLQAYLYRTPDDLERVLAAGGSVRLCKGAYLEPPTVAYPRKSDVDDAFARLLRRLLEHAATAPPLGPGRLPPAAIATHDERLIRVAIDEIHRLNLEPTHYEFQMLYGVRRDLQRRLLARGYPLRVYTPWGPEWYPYLTRRLAERPANLAFMVSSLLREATSRHHASSEPPRAAARR